MRPWGVKYHEQKQFKKEKNSLDLNFGARSYLCTKFYDTATLYPNIYERFTTSSTAIWTREPQTEFMKPQPLLVRSSSIITINADHVNKALFLYKFDFGRWGTTRGSGRNHSKSARRKFKQNKYSNNRNSNYLEIVQTTNSGSVIALRWFYIK